MFEKYIEQQANESIDSKKKAMIIKLVSFLVILALQISNHSFNKVSVFIIILGTLTLLHDIEKRMIFEYVNKKR